MVRRRHGRWLSEDPTGFDGGDPNLYRYVGNGVTYRTDPTGTTQAGNPLANLNLYRNPFGGGYSGNTVSAYKPVSSFVASAGRRQIFHAQFAHPILPQPESPESGLPQSAFSRHFSSCGSHAPR